MFYFSLWKCSFLKDSEKKIYSTSLSTSWRTPTLPLHLRTGTRNLRINKTCEDYRSSICIRFCRSQLSRTFGRDCNWWSKRCCCVLLSIPSHQWSCWYHCGMQVIESSYYHQPSIILGWYFALAYNIVMRHQFLGRLTGRVKPEECTSYNTAVYLTVSLSMITIIFSALEVILFKVYNRKVRHSSNLTIYHWHFCC